VSVPLPFSPRRREARRLALCKRPARRARRGLRAFLQWLLGPRPL
jgi:hypothetical protein